MSEDKITEEEFLKKLREAPDGFAKVWGYLMYGCMKAFEVSLRFRRKMGLRKKEIEVA